MLALLAIGLIPALVLSWVYEMTPHGLKRDAEFAVDKFVPAPGSAAAPSSGLQAAGVVRS